MDPINAALGIKTARSISNKATQTPHASKDAASLPNWLLPLRGHGHGSSSAWPSDAATAAAAKPRSKGRWGACLPAWWLRSKGRTFGIVAGVAVVVVLAALMAQLGIVGSQSSTLQLPLLAGALEQTAGTNGSSKVRVLRAPANHTADVLAALLLMYDPGSGEFSGMGWWNDANALEAIIDYAMLTNSSDFDALLANTFAKTGELNYLNNYFDDEGWWGVTWAKAHTLTGIQAYRDVAVGIYQDMQTNGWQQACGGGMLWRKGTPYMATISSALYMMIAMLLHESATSQAEKDSYVQAVQQTWAWLNQAGLVQPSGRLGDGMEGDCTLRQTPLFTYNQGVVMGALMRLAAATGNSSYLATAYKVANVTIKAKTNFADIFIDDCPTTTVSVDGCQFKGIFVRYLYDLYTVRKTPRYRKLLTDNAVSAWSSRDNSTNTFGVSWAGGYDPKPDATGVLQTVTLDLFNAVLGIALYG